MESTKTKTPTIKPTTGQQIDRSLDCLLAEMADDRARFGLPINRQSSACRFKVEIPYKAVRVHHMLDDPMIELPTSINMRQGQLRYYFELHSLRMYSTPHAEAHVGVVEYRLTDVRLTD